MDRRAHLQRLVDEHAPADPAENAARQTMRALLDSPGDPWDRRRFEPGHFTASGFVLTADASRVLLIFHERLERWLQPGGHVEAGDADLAAAARREVLEETGLGDLVAQAGALDLDVHPIPPGRSEPAHLHHDVRFFFRAAPEAAPRAGDGAADCRWFLIDELPDLSPEPVPGRVLGKLHALRRELRRGSGPPGPKESS